MTTKIPIFLTGATGYIGGSILSRLLSHPNASRFEITAFVRSPEKAKKLEQFGVKGVVGSFKTDLELLEQLAEGSHIVFDCAWSDDVQVIQAILKGLRNRHAKLGGLPILIRTSGTGVLTSGCMTKGNAVTGAIFDDSDPDQIEGIPPDTFHRAVDLAIVQADKEGYVRTHIILPSAIYGFASNPLVDACIMNPYSKLHMLTLPALDRKRAGMVGKGISRWPNVHIDDTADLYIILFDAILNNPEKVGHGRDGFYFAENGEHSWYEVSEAIGRAMVSLGLTDNEEPTTFSDEELLKYFPSVLMADIWGSNSRCRANHSRSIGWKPKYTTEDMLASMKPEIEYILKESN